MTRTRQLSTLPVVCLGLLALCAGLAHTDELCLTGNARGNRNLLVDFRVQPEGAKPLFDGSHRDALSVNWRSTDPIVLTFAEPVRLTRVEMVVYNDPQRSYNAAERMKLAVSRNGDAVLETEWVSLDQDPLLLCGTDDAIVWGSRTDAALSADEAIDSLAVSVEKNPGAQQSLLRELLVWGVPERLAKASEEPGASVEFRASENTYSSARVSWESLPAGTEYVRVRVRAKGADQWRTWCFTGSPGITRWLRPDADYEVTAEAVGAGCRPSSAGVQTLRLSHPLEVREMGDVWGMNFYPGGGGAHQAHADETAVTQRMIRLMSAAGVRHVRWFSPDPAGSDLFGDAGMSHFPFVKSEDAALYADLTGNRGVWLAATQNEPDFSDTLAEEFVEASTGPTAAARRFDELMAMAGPAVGGELVGPGSDYLRDCYRAGLKDAVDALDLHPYTKVATPTPPGGHLSGPEGVLYSLAECRKVMAEFDDGERPVIISEAGHPTHEGFWWMLPSDYEQQARYVVRTHLLLAAAGMRRIYWYAFQDEGTDPKNPEHHFGLVDWDGKPKPAYETYRTMTRLLSRAKCEGLETGLAPPAYAVRCALPGKYVTAVWDCGGSGEVHLDTHSEISAVVGLYGERIELPRAGEGRLVLPIDENVRYVFSKAPLRFVGQRRIAPPIEPRVDMVLRPATVRVKPGETASWNVALRSEYDCDVTAVVGCPSPWGGPDAQTEVTIPARGEAQVSLSLSVPEDAKPRIFSWDNRCQYEPADPRWAKGDFRRALFLITKQAGQ